METLFATPQFIHHGAVNGVTGSCHEYRLANNYGVLIDCGLFQGAESSGAADGAGSAGSHQINFALQHIKALIVTHVHIDHVGRIPYLLAAGFNGPIFCTIASATLLPLVLEDALKIGVTKDSKLIAAFLAKVQRLLVPCEFNCWTALPALGDAAPMLRFQPAGHILGSAYVELRQNTAAKQRYKTVFSGDLGAPYAPLLPAPKPPYAADTVVIESTYGDRLHDNRRERIKRLEQVLLHALQDNGTVLFPAFSIGRTQELLYELEAIVHRLRGQAIHQGLRWDELQIIVDSPLAAKFTQAYDALKSRWDKEAKQRVQQGRHPLSFAQLHTVDSHAQHLALVHYLASTRQPAIVIAASGMCEGGRVVNYLSALLPDPAHQVVFVGYQARGTLGAKIQHYGPKGGYVDIDGSRIHIGAEIITLSGYSAHADQQGLLRFVLGMRKRPQQVRIVHGDNEAKQALQQAFQQHGVNAVIAKNEP
ncbi:MBL fold metallo-hydrolase RNA specificity domain-containing protein [Rheinheimera baltica]|uniref:MBL fold metallo-hydrolase RNA specificity domain-containing protein n=1 Tax=Rheinheimera baltica TaxID=67576 RepID=UPI00273EDE66|nr:MBL fold metallo-hydrolase [Rheinheimera baltica]MDP5189005.1 MBL fold metallo-hydrolase [Rheinheimera baltica]